MEYRGVTFYSFICNTIPFTLCTSSKLRTGSSFHCLSVVLHCSEARNQQSASPASCFRWAAQAALGCSCQQGSVTLSGMGGGTEPRGRQWKSCVGNLNNFPPFKDSSALTYQFITERIFSLGSVSVERQENLFWRFSFLLSTYVLRKLQSVKFCGISHFYMG